MRILLIGATGLVGGLLAGKLLERGHEVHALVRRPTGRSAQGWHEQVGPVGEWRVMVTRAGPIDAAVSCLGTTWAKVGSERAFRAVDQDAVIAFAEAARAAGVRHLLAVSSVGANARSRNFYLRVKGETDEALAAIGFKRLDIFRPGLLLGERGDDRRRGERIAIALNPVTSLFLRGRWSRFAGMEADTVAEAVGAAAEQGGSGQFIHENGAIRRLASGAAAP
jgi:uncharacterized protein YbjT (DUF2867 family)